jgi:hypothetical protein
MLRNTSTIVILAIVGFVIWRNYGVIALGETIDPDKNKTNEQKELKSAVNKVGTINVGQIIKTSFGVYEWTDIYGVLAWVKTKEIWDA